MLSRFLLIMWLLYPAFQHRADPPIDKSSGCVIALSDVLSKAPFMSWKAPKAYYMFTCSLSVCNHSVECSFSGFSSSAGKLASMQRQRDCSWHCLITISGPCSPWQDALHCGSNEHYPHTLHGWQDWRLEERLCCSSEICDVRCS
jgi:hypothetical protein